LSASWNRRTNAAIDTSLSPLAADAEDLRRTIAAHAADDAAAVPPSLPRLHDPGECVSLLLAEQSSFEEKPMKKLCVNYHRHPFAYDYDVYKVGYVLEDRRTGEIVGGSHEIRSLVRAASVAAPAVLLVAAGAVYISAGSSAGPLVAALLFLVFVVVALAPTIVHTIYRARVGRRYGSVQRHDTYRCSVCGSTWSEPEGAGNGVVTETIDGI
jgi:hypothetical protein